MQASLQFVRFVAVGLVNTLIGYGAFAVLYRGLDVPPLAANAISYAVALSIAYWLYRLFVFAADRHRGGSVVRFAVCFVVAFGLNQAVLYGLLTTSCPAMLAQVGAMATYTLVFFVLNKTVVFVAAHER
jgi:putative flippase GtrA